MNLRDFYYKVKPLIPKVSSNRSAKADRHSKAKVSP